MEPNGPVLGPNYPSFSWGPLELPQGPLGVPGPHFENQCTGEPSAPPVCLSVCLSVCTWILCYAVRSLLQQLW